MQNEAIIWMGAGRIGMVIVRPLNRGVLPSCFF